ncbi:uncharacterized protein PpBr36_06101, partial [Pyricularia pennisetigena]|uniref:uncharacterized protein n=1 Tax=Pyricularia pennisetigena TaxID=1578925 RepID=UPI00115311EE
LRRYRSCPCPSSRSERPSGKCGKNFDDKAGAKGICNWSERCTWVTHCQSLQDTIPRSAATERFAALHLR